MPSKDEDNQPDRSVPREAGGEHDFDEDTEEEIKLPRVKPEVTADDDIDKKKAADSAFDDQEIEIDEDDLKAESEGETPGRRY
jgi:hypothetical protein